VKALKESVFDARLPGQSLGALDQSRGLLPGKGHDLLASNLEDVIDEPFQGLAVGDGQVTLQDDPVKARSHGDDQPGKLGDEARRRLHGMFHWDWAGRNPILYIWESTVFADPFWLRRRRVRSLIMRWRCQSAFRRVASAAQVLVLVGLIVATGRGQDSRNDKIAPVSPTISGAEKVVQEQVDAYNRHDLEAFLKTYSAEIKLYEFPDKELSSGLEAMRETYGKLFRREPDRKVKIAKRIVQGDCVIDHEELSGGGRQFTAVAIYRVKDGKITAAWFLK
jgi:hypothetical protein